MCIRDRRSTAPGTRSMLPSGSRTARSSPRRWRRSRTGSRRPACSDKITQHFCRLSLVSDDPNNPVDVIYFVSGALGKQVSGRVLNLAKLA
eukprot:12677595-Alexandrium_andersonii.AAC.1